MKSFCHYCLHQEWVESIDFNVDMLCLYCPHDRSTAGRLRDNKEPPPPELLNALRYGSEAFLRKERRNEPKL